MEMLNEIIAQVEDFGLGFGYEQAYTTFGKFGTKIANTAEELMSYKSMASVLGFLGGVAIDAYVISEAFNKNPAAITAVSGKAAIIGASLVKEGIKKLKNRNANLETKMEETQ